VRECARLFTNDILWQNAIKENKAFAKAFFLDALIEQEQDLSFRKTGQAMGALLMVKIPELELSDIVNEDYSMEKINQAIMKTVLGV
jgi:hypothetical protein